MAALIGVILAVVAAILKLVNQHLNWIIWLLIISVILIGAEVVWGWRRGGYYRVP
jgi:type III secretory pathway component EscS